MVGQTCVINRSNHYHILAKTNRISKSIFSVLSSRSPRRMPSQILAKSGGRTLSFEILRSALVDAGTTVELIA
jgi:hypothetical protein